MVLHTQRKERMQPSVQYSMILWNIVLTLLVTACNWKWTLCRLFPVFFQKLDWAFFSDQQPLNLKLVWDIEEGSYIPTWRNPNQTEISWHVDCLTKKSAQIFFFFVCVYICNFQIHIKETLFRECHIKLTEFTDLLSSGTFHLKNRLSRRKLKRIPK